MTREEPAFKIKNGNISVLQLHILTPDLAQLKKELAQRLANTPDFFSSTPIVLEISGIADTGESFDFIGLTSFMRERGMCAAGVVGGSVAQREEAIQAGLGVFLDTPVRTILKKDAEPVVLTEQVELPGFTEVAGDEPLIPPQVQARPTLVIDKPVRTGQRIYAEGANLVVLAIVNAGAELIADGDIHVYAPMRGKAIAGAQGNETARIFVNSMEAELLSIAGCFKVFEEGIPDDVRAKPAHVHLDGSRLVIAPLNY